MRRVVLARPSTAGWSAALALRYERFTSKARTGSSGNSASCQPACLLPVRQSVRRLSVVWQVVSSTFAEPRGRSSTPRLADDGRDGHAYEERCKGGQGRRRAHASADLVARRPLQPGTPARRLACRFTFVLIADDSCAGAVPVLQLLSRPRSLCRRTTGCREHAGREVAGDKGPLRTGKSVLLR